MNTSKWNEKDWGDYARQYKSYLSRMKRNQKIERIIMMSKHQKELDLLALDLAEQLQEVDDMEMKIEKKLYEIKNEQDPIKVCQLNREIKVLLESWKEMTNCDYEI